MKVSELRPHYNLDPIAPPAHPLIDLSPPPPSDQCKSTAQSPLIYHRLAPQARNYRPHSKSASLSPTLPLSNLVHFWRELIARISIAVGRANSAGID